MFIIRVFILTYDTKLLLVNSYETAPLISPSSFTDDLSIELPTETNTPDNGGAPTPTKRKSNRRQRSR